MGSEERALQLKRICADFLSGPWKVSSSITVEQLKDGFMNEIYVCSSRTSGTKVIIRFINQDARPLCAIAGEVGEAIVFDALYSSGLGPKLLGALSGLRVEEHLNSRSLRSMECRQPNVLIAVAQQLAKLHSLDVPLIKSPDAVLVKLKELASGPRIEMDTSALSQEVIEKLNCITSIDYKEELNWIISTIDRISSRVVLTHSDFYPSNILVLLPEPDLLTAKDIKIIDVEMAAYFHRGIDLGQFFSEFSFDYANTSRPTFLVELDLSSKQLFVESYLEQWIDLNPDLYDPRIDNVTNVLLEAELLGLLIYTLFPLWFFREVSKDPAKADPQFLDFFLERQKCLIKQKARLIKLIN